MAPALPNTSKATSYLAEIEAPVGLLINFSMADEVVTAHYKGLKLLNGFVLGLHILENLTILDESLSSLVNLVDIPGAVVVDGILGEDVYFCPALFYTTLVLDKSDLNRIRRGWS